MFWTVCSFTWIWRVGRRPRLPRRTWTGTPPSGVGGCAGTQTGPPSVLEENYCLSYSCLYLCLYVGLYLCSYLCLCLYLGLWIWYAGTQTNPPVSLSCVCGCLHTLVFESFQWILTVTVRWIAIFVVTGHVGNLHFKRQRYHQANFHYGQCH